MRGAVAWARLGGFIWLGKKEEGKDRECNLCGKVDGIGHMMVECEGLVEEREILKTNGRGVEMWNTNHWLKTKEKENLIKMGKFWERVRIKRMRVA